MFSSNIVHSCFTLGCRQAVRHWFLVPAFGGSNPPFPAKWHFVLLACYIMSLSISSWNLNSINARLAHLEKFLTKHSPDILLLQELRCIAEDIPYDLFSKFGYCVEALGQKSHNGVAIASKYPLNDIKNVDFGKDYLPDSEPGARYLEGSILTDSNKKFTIASIYVPNGTDVASNRFVYKLEFLKDLCKYLKNFTTPSNLFLIGGDFNVAPEPIDVFDPVALDGCIGFHKDERKEIRSILNCGISDSFRLKYPNKAEFTWWSYRYKLSFEYNRGMRLDYILLSPSMTSLLQDVIIHKEMRINDDSKPSDHVPITCYLST